jgi:succinate dehydrogenase / fumarate reductase, flavoprotein subunit
MDPNWRKVNLVCSLDGGEVKLIQQPVPRMRPDLLALFDRTEMSKYLTDEEMAVYDDAVAAGHGGSP